MTTEEKYLTVLKALGKVIAEQDFDIQMKEHTIRALREKIEELEKEGEKKNGNTIRN